MYLAAIVLVGCKGDSSRGKSQRIIPQKMRILHINGMTPVKNQGRGSACWAYAMLAAIETTHISMGDSVNLSPAWAVRALMEDAYVRNVMTKGADRGSARGMGMTLLNIIRKDGIVPYDSYPDREGRGAPTGIILNKTRLIAEKAVNSRRGPEVYQKTLDDMLDDSMGHRPRNVYMYSAQYTPMEFAHSVCREDEYIGIASCTHHPFGEWFVMETADNWERNLFYNMKIEEMMAIVEEAVREGKGVCWEGDISEEGFSFRKGIADLDLPKGKDVQQERQRGIESYKTTDDHCMAIVGLARNASGKTYFIMKNSWGTDNPYGGLMYMSEDYMRMKTIAVILPWQKNNELSTTQPASRHVRNRSQRLDGHCLWGLSREECLGNTVWSTSRALLPVSGAR